MKTASASCLIRRATAIACGLLSTCAFAQSHYAPPYTFTTLAGNIPGGADGIGSAARFSSPNGVALDSAGNIYVADTQNNTIRKITSGGEVTTIAGTEGPGGSADGTGPSAQFQTPYGLAVDAAGNLYVADSGNDTIRKITPAGVVTTVAGTAGIAGTADGTGATAQFNGPQGIAVDSAGNLYVADTYNTTIRLITPSGTVTTLAGRFVVPPQVDGVTYRGSGGGYADGTGSAALFASPQGIAVDQEGNVFVADSGYNNLIREVTPAGVVTTLAGTGEWVGVGSVDGTGSAAMFDAPQGLAIDGAGNLYVADADTHTNGDTGSIRKITPVPGPGGTSWMVTTLAGGTNGGLNRPFGVAVDATGNLYVANTGADTISELTPGGVVGTLAGSPPPAGLVDGTGSAAEFDAPSSVAVDNGGNVYVADGAIRKISPSGVVTSLALSGVSASGLAVDNAGNIYVADSGNNTISKVSSGGVATILAGGGEGSADGTGSAAQFNSPNGVAVDVIGNVYVADTENDTIRKITPTGVVTTLAGTAGWAGIGNADGAGSAARFSWPEGIAVDSAGTVYVADTLNNTIRKITSGGVVTTLAGGTPPTWGGNSQSSSADGTGVAAQFFSPYGVAVDGSGNVYVADTENNTIRKITPSGVVTTLAGTASPYYSARTTAAVSQLMSQNGFGTPTAERSSLVSVGSANGTGSEAQFNAPEGIAVDAAGNVYVADTGNNSIRKGSPANLSYIAIEPQNQAVLMGETATFAVSMSEASGFTYQWKVSADGGIIWTNLTDGDGVSGSTTATLSLVAQSAAQNSNEYECVITTATSSATTFAVTLTVGIPTPVTPYAFSTLAGSASDQGSADGTGSAARFYGPGGIAVDNEGNIYVADWGNDTIRKITPAGVVTTLAGAAGQQGSTDGTGSAAQFSYPEGVAVDSAGNVYVADTGNNTIRKIVPTGDVSTLAGTANPLFGQGASDGTGNAAQFHDPSGIAVDGEGNVYVADTWNYTIRKVTAAGVVTTLGGSAGQQGSTDGTGSTARFDGPQGLAVDSAGDVYVADTFNDTIRKITPAGVVTTIAGMAGRTGSLDLPGAAARFDLPVGVAVDSAGNVYVVDNGNDTIRMITPALAVETLAGLAGQAGSVDGTGNAARLQSPWGVAVDHAGNIYVADSGNETIRKGSPSSAPYFALAPQSQTVNPGSDVVLTATASGDSALSYQWSFNGTAIAGATGPTLALGAVQAGSAGAYRVTVTDASGNQTTSSAATLTVSQSALPGISEQPLSQTVASGGTVVFTVNGGGSVQTSSLATPTAELAMVFSGTSYQWQFNGANLTDGFGVSGSTGPQLMIGGVGAANQGDYSCIVTTAGVAARSNVASLMVEDTSNPGRIIGLSGRGFVGTGNDILIGGFYIIGSTSATVLIQALGPALTDLDVPGALAHPVLTIHQTQNGQDVVLYSNTGWGSSQVLQNAAAAAYAQPVLTPGTADSELLVTLPPGGYTAEVTGADGGTGVALVGVYELP